MLVALPISKQPSLLMFDQQGAPEEAPSDLPFYAIGSGQACADPFLAFLRRIFWKDQLPSFAGGVFAVLWTLNHAIKTTPGGIADPKQIVTLKRDGDSYVALELMDEDLQEHLEAIEAAEARLADFKRSLSEPAPGEATPPTPPKP